jgi:hypothetical protein
MAAAPDESPKIYTDYALAYWADYETGKEDPAGGKNFLRARIENDDGSDGFIGLTNYVKGFAGSTHFGYSANSAMYISENDYKSMMEGSQVRMTEDEALAKAQKVMDDLGIKDMVLYEASKAVSADYPDKGGYRLEYLRGSGSIAGYDDYSGWNAYKEEQPPQYTPPFHIERLTIIVTEDGVQHFVWRGITRVVETVNANVELLPFDKILQALKNQIKYKKSFEEGYPEKDKTIIVTSAELQMYYIGVKDYVDQALLVPVWVFRTDKSAYNTAFKMTLSFPDNVYLINAINGGVIDMTRFDYSDEQIAIEKR